MHKLHAGSWGTNMSLPLAPSLDMAAITPGSRLLGLAACSVQGLKRHCTVASTRGGAVTVATFLDLLPYHVRVSSCNYIIMASTAYILTEFA